MPDDNPGGTAAEPTPWFSQVTDAEVIGHAQTKGWDKLDPHAAFSEAVKAHRNAERMVGVPQEQLLRLPKDSADEAAWKAVWQKLGAPDKPEGYDFQGLDFEDDTLTKGFHDAIRATAAKLGVPKTMAEQMARAMYDYLGDRGAAEETERSALLKVEQEQLTRDWGDAETTRFKANMFVADRAAEALGVTPDQLAKLKDGLGAAGVARLFHKIGVGMGEDKFVSGTNPQDHGIMTREQAVARRSELMGDPMWTKAYLAGDKAKLREMQAINTIISG